MSFALLQGRSFAQSVDRGVDGVTEISTGLLTMDLASSRISGEKIAEKQVLTFWWQQSEDLSDVVDKSHVEHPVGFIEYQDFDVVESNGVLAMQIQKTSGGCDQYIDTAS